MNIETENRPVLGIRPPVKHLQRKMETLNVNKVIIIAFLEFKKILASQTEGSKNRSSIEERKNNFNFRVTR